MSGQERSPYVATGYRMIESIDIKNFRCFEHASVKGCKEINIIVGGNASGKTAFLEAIFLAVGPSPELASRFKTWRNFDPGMIGTQEEIEDAMWSDLFFKLDKNKNIEIKLRGTGLHKRSLKVEYGSFEPITSVSEGGAWAPSPISFKWVNYKRTIFPVRPQFTGNAFQFRGAEHPPVEATFIGSSHPVSNQENVKRFGNLSKKRLETDFLATLAKEYPFIKGISIQPYAGISMLYADIESIPEKIPLNLVSSGVSKLASLLLAIANQPKGILLVDEIENGFHYSHYGSIWRSLRSFCNKFDVQLFASTHSRECLEASTEVFNEFQAEMALMQIIRDDAGNKAYITDGASATAAIEGGIEVRR
jgi:AAA15 family ATPase/GTPase